MMNSLCNITVYCRLGHIKPDTRQYQQDGVYVYPTSKVDYNITLEEQAPLFVAVEIPLDKKYIHNYLDFRTEEQITTELMNDTPKEEIELPDPILTIEGLKFLRDALQEEFSTETLEVSNDEIDKIKEGFN